MFDDLLKANESTLFERFILRCVAPSLLLTALLHADFEDRAPYLLLRPYPLIPFVGVDPTVSIDPTVAIEGALSAEGLFSWPWPACSLGPVRRMRSSRSPRARLPACWARSTTAPAGAVSPPPPGPPPPPTAWSLDGPPPPP